MCTKGVLLGDVCEREVRGISVNCCRLVIDEDNTKDVSVINDLVLLDVVTGVTLRVWEAVLICDSVLEDRLGAKEMYQEKNPG